jgi:hypothetical protein
MHSLMWFDSVTYRNNHIKIVKISRFGRKIGLSEVLG